MPFGDRTGPYGYGPRTGRGLGICSGYTSPGYTRGFPRGGRGRGWKGPGFGYGFRGGRGFGLRPRFGLRFWNYPPREIPVPRYDIDKDLTYERSLTPVKYEYKEEDEIEDLKNYAEELKKELEAVEKRLNELESKK